MSGTDVLDAPAGVNLGAALARANPVAKLAVSLAVSLALLLTVDPVTAGAALALELLALPWCGLGPRALLRRGWVVLAGAVPAGVATAVFGTGSVPVPEWLVPLGPGWLPVLAGAAITLRVLAIGLPGVVLLATTDPTDLADALAQLLRLPARFVLSALASMRLFGVLAEEWKALTLARRARGLGDGGPVGWARAVSGQVFALLVLAIRRATVLATTMEARGFGTDRERTWARPSRFTGRDAAVVAGGVALAVLATLAGIAAGSWRLLLS